MVLRPLRFCLSFLLTVLFPIYGGALLAQDLSGLSICVDAGHGRGNTNHGPTGLREAEVNVRVALLLKDFLKRANIDTVLLTRVDDSTNPSLSQREALANTFGVDWFHSVHHNALDGTRRSTLLLYEEERTAANLCPNGSPRGTGQPDWPGLADAASKIIAQRILAALRTSAFTDRLDWTFFGGCNGGFSLGVLNDLLMPGELSEATFHDNPVEERKLRSESFLRLEAQAIYMAFLEFFEAGQMTTGTLAGIVTDEASGETVNGAVVTLVPGGMTFTTDNHGNGFYAFQDLEPGSYRVSAALAGSGETQKQVDVRQHQFTFSDLELPANTPPVVTLTVPANGAVGVDVYKEIGARFNRSMQRESVETAFGVTPAARGHFIWSDASDVVLFEPDTRFDFDTEYTVRISASATDSFGRPLDGNGDGTAGDDFFWSFKTQSLDNSSPVVLDFVPTRRDTGVFIRDVFQARFNRELDPETVNPATVLLTSDGGGTFDLHVDYLQDGSHTLTAVPVEPVPASARYFMTLATGLHLVDGTPMRRNFRWQFHTQTARVGLNFWDDFEGPFQWADPNDSPGTQHIDPDSTSFTASGRVALSDTLSGELEYKFVGAQGVVRLDLLQEVEIDLEQDKGIGVYIYGDTSRNEIRLLLGDSDGEEGFPWTPIDWFGWRLLKFDFALAELEAGDGGNGRLDGVRIHIVGLELGFRARGHGTLFFDDFFVSRLLAPVFAAPGSRGPAGRHRFVLLQNYPNPFNPETVISYEILPTAGLSAKVVLQVFNLNGRHLETLVNSVQPAGHYRIPWDGRDAAGRLLANGVYIYRLRVGNFAESRRMILLK
ncbi:MAG: Ig-like domain-containing protein [bacterium]